jgi:hypothetical protein
MTESKENEGQLRVEQKLDEPPPSHMWKTALGRAVFGFYAEVGSSSYFVNDNYIAKLSETENKLSETYGKILLYSFGFSIFSLVTANKALGDIAYLGFRISTIPYLTELCMLVLSFLIAVTVVFAMDVHAVTRMRIEIFSVTGSESPHMRMVIFKGNGAWMDALLPKSIGYSSNFFHHLIQAIALVWAFLIPLSSLLVSFSALLVCALSLSGLWVFGLSSLMAWVSIVIASLSVLVLILVTMVPLRFSFRSSQSGD